MREVTYLYDLEQHLPVNLKIFLVPWIRVRCSVCASARVAMGDSMCSYALVITGVADLTYINIILVVVTPRQDFA